MKKLGTVSKTLIVVVLVIFLALIVTASVFGFSELDAVLKLKKNAVSFNVSDASYAPDEITVMTYNIRQWTGDRFGNRRWGIRFPYLLDNIRESTPDVIGVQEMQKTQENDLDKYLLGYEKVVMYRNNTPLFKESMGIYFRSDRFELHENSELSGGFWLSETPYVESKGWDAAHKRVCAFVTLVEKGTGFVFTVFNTHLDHKGKQAREESIKFVQRKINDFNAENVILMGDFNFNERDENYAFATEKFLNAKYHPEDVHRKSEGRTANSYADKPSDSTDAIDHIFYNGNLTSFEYEVIQNTPNGIYPSDHFPVVARFRK